MIKPKKILKILNNGNGKKRYGYIELLLPTHISNIIDCDKHRFYIFYEKDKLENLMGFIGYLKVDVNTMVITDEDDNIIEWLIPIAISKKDEYHIDIKMLDIEVADKIPKEIKKLLN